MRQRFGDRIGIWVSDNVRVSECDASTLVRCQHRLGFVPSGFKCGLEILSDDRTKGWICAAFEKAKRSPAATLVGSETQTTATHKLCKPKVVSEGVVELEISLGRLAR